MGLRWGRWLTAVALLAPSPVTAQRVAELGVQATAVAADPSSVVAGGYGAIHTSLRSRLSVAAGVGASDGKATLRGELLAHFLLNPTRRRGAALYLAGGVAVIGGPVDEGYLVLALGIESRPGTPSGWFVEAGVGGGARVAVGFRRRWFPAARPF
jgi:hypothetical protein